MQCADDVLLVIQLGVGNRLADLLLGGDVNDTLHVVVAQGTAYQLGVENRSLDENSSCGATPLASRQIVDDDGLLTLFG